MKKWAGVFTFNLTILIALLIAIEIFLENNNDIEHPNNTLGRFIRLREEAMPNQKLSMRPPPSHLKVSDNLPDKDFFAKTDSFGFIESETNLVNAKINIVFLGGSTTECFFVDDSLRFPSLVGKMFQNDGLSINTFNSGVSKSHSLHSINILINKVIHEDFQVAVMMHNINDLVHLSYNGSYYEEKNSPTRSNIVTITKPEISNHDLSYFRNFGVGFRLKKAYQLLFPDTYFRLHNARNKVADSATPEEFQWVRPGPIHGPQGNQFRSNIKTFVAICRANGITPVLMTQFNRFIEAEFYYNPKNKIFLDKIKNSSITVEEFCQAYRDFNTIIREVSKSENVLLVDLDEEVPKTKDYLYDYVHVNNRGSKLAATIIYRDLKKVLQTIH